MSSARCQHCHLPIHEIRHGVHVDDTGGDVCCADKFTQKNENGEHQPTQEPKWRYSGGDWVLDDFDEWSELTKERDAYRADAEAERHRNPSA